MWQSVLHFAYEKFQKVTIRCDKLGVVLIDRTLVVYILDKILFLKTFVFLFYFKFTEVHRSAIWKGSSNSEPF